MPSISATSAQSPRGARGTELDSALRQHYRYPMGAVNLELPHEPASEGFFRFGAATCFGPCSLPRLPRVIEDANLELPDATEAVTCGSGVVRLPFHPGEVADNLRLEYHASVAEHSRLLNSQWVRSAYYLTRNFIPVSVRKYLQRVHLADWHRIPFPAWPVDCSVELMFEQILRLALQADTQSAIPFIWFWPHRHKGCLVMTHDVEYPEGRDFCSTVMDLDESVGLRSSFQIIPEDRYDVPAKLLKEIRARGHEINVHDLNHDGYLFPNRERFLERVHKIRMYARQFGAKGFRSGGLYRKLEWYDQLGFSYDMSVPNVPHLDPQRGGCCSVMPYFIGDVLELPLTTTQDYSLFHILQDYSLELWDRQIAAVLECNGLLTFNIHPDYVIEERALAVYVALLSRLSALTHRSTLWAALPGEVNRWWRERSQMELVRDGRGWRVTGEGSERACIAYATLDGERLTYRFDS